MCPVKLSTFLVLEILDGFEVLCCKVYKVQEESVKSQVLSAPGNVLVNDPFYRKLKKEHCSKNCHSTVHRICKKHGWFKLPSNIYFLLLKFKNSSLGSCLNNLGLVLTVHIKILSHRMLFCCFISYCEWLVCQTALEDREVLVGKKEMGFLPKSGVKDGSDSGDSSGTDLR